MSHFTVAIVLPLGLEIKGSEDEIADAIGPLLAPFDENMSVPEYIEKCHCVGREAKSAAREFALKKHGTIDDLRKKFHEKFPALAKVDQFTCSDEELLEKAQTEWENFLKPLEQTTERAEKAHKLYNKPKADCSDCHGTGKRPTTYNPKSQWDWYSIGGRWDGYWGGKNFTTVKTFLKHYEKWSTFAYITPDGEWHQKGDMGWWGMTANEKKKDVWEAEVKKFLEPLLKHRMVLVDCHI